MDETLASSDSLNGCSTYRLSLKPLTHSAWELWATSGRLASVRCLLSDLPACPAECPVWGWERDTGSEVSVLLKDDAACSCTTVQKQTSIPFRIRNRQHHISLWIEGLRLLIVILDYYFRDIFTFLSSAGCMVTFFSRSSRSFIIFFTSSSSSHSLLCSSAARETLVITHALRVRAFVTRVRDVYSLSLRCSSCCLHLAKYRLALSSSKDNSDPSHCSSFTQYMDTLSRSQLLPAARLGLFSDREILSTRKRGSDTAQKKERDSSDLTLTHTLFWAPERHILTPETQTRMNQKAGQH